TLNERNQEDASAPLGMATVRHESRIASALMGAGPGPVQFESHQGVCGAGVLFTLPALISQGLLKARDIYTYPRRFYYSLESILLTLAFMALSRIKNPEQLKQCKPGEIGRIIGLDRIAEVRCLRGKIKFLADQHKAIDLNHKLIDEWYKMPDDAGSYLYIDGHQRIYYGHKAKLPLKY